MPITTFMHDRSTATQLRGLTWLTLTETGMAYAGSATGDSGGGAVYAWSSRGTTECRLDPAGGRGGRLVGGRIDERSTHVATVPADYSVDVTDRFVVIGRGTFEVTATHDRTDSVTVSRFELIEIEDPLMTIV